MKRFAVALILMALILGSLAANAASATFATRSGEIFQLFLNGRLLNGRGTSQVIIDRLPAGPQNIEFRVPARRGVLTYCTNVFLTRGFETNYILMLPGRNPNFFLREVGRQPLYPPVACSTCPAAPRPNYGVYDDFDGYGNQPGNYHNAPNQPGQNYNNYNQGSYNNAPGYGNNYNNNPAPGYGNNNSNPAPGYGNNYNNQPVNLMSTYDVGLLLESMRRQSFDNTKADVAK